MQKQSSLLRTIVLSALAHFSVIGCSNCSATQVQMQSTAADELAKGWNRIAKPALRAAYESDQQKAIDSVCPVGLCAAEPMFAAVQRVRAAWKPVWVASEIARVSHDMWRETLEVCRHTPDAGATCTVTIASLSQTFVTAVTAFRCALRDVNHAELDTMKAELKCAAPSDAGVLMDGDVQ